MTRVRGFAIYVAPAIAYLAVLFTLSSLSTPPAPEFGLEWGDKINHAGAYALLGVLLTRASRYLLAATTLRMQLIASVAAGLLYGMFDEVYQTFVPGRFGDVTDWLADALGVGTATALLWLFRDTSVVRRVLGNRYATIAPTARQSNESPS